MRITDIIRGILDQLDQSVKQPAPEPVVQEPEFVIAVPQEEQEPDLVAIIQQLAGLESPEAEYANEPCEVVAPIGAAFPGGDDVHSRKNPADIRTNAPSMYPGYQAGGR
jgi:hypothetical protein